MDALSPVFESLHLSARVFYAGSFCGSANYDLTGGNGMLHVLRRGCLRVLMPRGDPVELSEPSVLFYRKACQHRLEADSAGGVDLVCAHVRFGSGAGESFMASLPDPLILPTRGIEGIEATQSLLFAEAFAERCGREAAIDRLVEYLVVLLLRHHIETGRLNFGVFAALSDKQLGKAMAAMHARPEVDWTVDSLGRTAGMSRARFAARFRETVGSTPLDYLTDWRINVAQSLLKRGRPVKVVASQVGYSSPAAFVRAFSRKVGLSPAKWSSDQSEPARVVTAAAGSDSRDVSRGGTPGESRRRSESPLGRRGRTVQR